MWQMWRVTFFVTEKSDKRDVTHPMGDAPLTNVTGRHICHPLGESKSDKCDAPLTNVTLWGESHPRHSPNGWRALDKGVTHPMSPFGVSHICHPLREWRHICHLLINVTVGWVTSPLWVMQATIPITENELCFEKWQMSRHPPNGWVTWHLSRIWNGNLGRSSTQTDPYMSLLTHIRCLVNPH